MWYDDRKEGDKEDETSSQNKKRVGVRNTHSNGVDAGSIRISRRYKVE